MRSSHKRQKLVVSVPTSDLLTVPHDTRSNCHSCRMMAGAGMRIDCLAEDEIVLFVSSVFSLNLVKEQLANPSQVIVTKLYELFLEELGVSNFHQPDLTATQDIQYIDRYVDFMLLSNVRLCVEELLRQTGYPGEFSLLDMVQPKKKKVLRILSHLIRLWTETDELRLKWEQNAAALDTKQKEREQLHKRLQSLQKTLEEKGLQASKKRKFRDELEKQLVAMNKKFEDEKLLGQSLNNEYKASKAELVSMMEKHSELEVELCKLREEISQLESMIVRSPEKVTAETEAMDRQVAAKLSEKRRLHHEYVEAMNQSDTVVQAQKDLKPAIETLRETFSELEILKDKCVVADDMKEKVQNLDQKNRELDVVAEQSRENVSGLQNQLKKNRIQYKNQLNPLLKMNEDVKQDIARKREACDGSSAGQKQLLQEEMSLLKQQEDLKSQRQRHDQQFNSCVLKIRKAVQSAVDSKTIIN